MLDIYQFNNNIVLTYLSDSTLEEKLLFFWTSICWRTVMKSSSVCSNLDTKRVWWEKKILTSIFSGTILEWKLPHTTNLAGRSRIHEYGWDKYLYMQRNWFM